MADRDDLDGRIRRAWADLGPDDHVHPPLPDEAWDAVARATTVAPPTVAPDGRDAPRPRPARPTRRRWTRVAVAAAVVVALGTAAVAAASLRRDDPTVEARAALGSEGLIGSSTGTGSAELIEVDGRLLLDVSVEGIGAGDDAVLEVWLLDPATDGLRSLGLVDGEVRLPVPAGIDLDRFSVVDVSREPLDGDPAHSAESVVRGPLAPT